MKRKRILSLLLALTVMATMLMAVPLTGYAENTIVVYSLTSDYSDGNDYSSLTGGTDSIAYTDTINGLTGYGCFSNVSNSASYTYTDTSNESHSYSFTNAWQAGAGNTTKRCLYFTPESPCTVTAVFFGSDAQRSMTIYQSSSVTATTEGSSAVDTVQLEITDTSLPVYVYGGSSNKYLYAIIVDYGEASTDLAISAEGVSVNAGDTTGATISVDAENFTPTSYTYAFVTDSTGETAATVTENEDGSTSYSTDSSTFTLTNDGKVTVDENAKNGETAYVKVTGTYTPEEGDAETASCIVTVTAVNVVLVTEVSVSPEEATIYLGQTKTLTATVSPEDATDTSVTWSSSDKEVATVDESSGKVSPVKTGTATITATANDGSGKTGSATIEVKDPTYPADNGTIKINSDDNGYKTISTSDLTAASESKIYSLLDTAETAKGDNAANEDGAYAYKTGYKYFGGEVAFVGNNGNLYQRKKTTQDIDGTTNSNGIRIKTNQDVVAVHLAEGSTVRVYITGGGGSSRYGYLTTSKIKNLSTSTYASESTAQTGDLKNYATDLLEYTATSDTIAYISATGDSFISELQVIVPGEADSGCYTNASDETVGVIRFLQSYADDNISSYGFYFVDSEGEITTYNKSVSGTGSVDNGFYGDITDIPEAKLDDTYYALPFVTYENIDDPVYMSVITQVGVSDTTVTYPED